MWFLFWFWQGFFRTAPLNGPFSDIKSGTPVFSVHLQSITNQLPKWCASGVKTSNVLQRWVIDLCWSQSQKFWFVISKHINKISVSNLMSCEHAWAASHVCSLSSYFPYWPVLRAHVCASSACSTNVFTVFVKGLCCCLKARSLDPRCEARVWPGAPLSMGHRLHHARSCSSHVGKWTPCAPALLPPSVVHRHTADRTSHHLDFLCKSRPLLFLSFGLRSPLSRLSLFSTPQSRIVSQQSEGLISVPGSAVGFFCHSGLDVLLNPTAKPWTVCPAHSTCIAAN